MKTEWKKIGMVAVDSGTLMIGDPCYLDGDGWTEKDYKKYVCGMKGDYEQVPFTKGHVGKALIFSSGLGDGCYEVFAKIKDIKDWGKRVTEVKIVLIEEDEVEVIE